MAGFVERDRCPLCDSGALTTLRSVDFAHPTVWSYLERRYEGRARRRELAGRLFEVARCAICQLSFHRFVLNDGALERLYEEWLPDSRASEPRSVDLTALERHARGEPERVLDLAAATGEWSMAARARGFDVIAVERSDTRRKHLRELGVECCASIDDVARASIDYAHCDRIFEHLPHPVETLVRLSRCLAPGGTVRIQVPDATRATRDVTASYWAASDDALRPLEHVNGFTAPALCALGRAADFKIAEAPRRFSFGSRNRAPLTIELAHSTR